MKHKRAQASLDSFDALPAELSQRIFSLACLDDGTTGRSLSLVSRSISHLSRPVKYQCLAIRNIRQAIRVAAILENTLPSDRRIIHLFVRTDYRQMYDYALYREDYYATNLNLEDGPRSPLGRVTSTLSRILRIPGHDSHRKGVNPFLNPSLNLHRGGRSHVDPILRWPIPNHAPLLAPTLEADMTRALLRILTTIAPTLQSFTLLIHQPYADLSLAALPPLPSLQEFTLMYAATLSPKIPPDSLLRSLPGPFPALKRLHLEWNSCGCGPQDLLKLIGRLAPGLTHVRLPSDGVWWHRLWHDTDTHKAQGVREPLQHLPSTVQRIHIRPPVQTIGPYHVALERFRGWAAKDERVILDVVNTDEYAQGKWMSKMEQTRL